MFWVVKKKSLIVALVLVVAIVAVCASAGSVSTAVAAKKLLPIYSVETSENKVALSFDAAWGADKTREIMDTLEKYDAKGTFFLVGFWVDKYPDLVKEIAARGHLIGNHSNNHLHMSALKSAEMQQEIAEANSKIAALVGYTPAYFRAPFGEYDNKMLSYLAETNVQCIQWSIDSLDWKGLSGAEIAERVVPNLKSGAIVLMHNNSDHVLDALPAILLAVKNKGLTAVKMDELVYKEGYSIDANGKQIKNQ